MVEIIKENQFRIALIMALLAFYFFIGYAFLQANVNRPFMEAVKIWANWFFIGSAIFVLFVMRPLIKQVWEQTSIRDDAERQALLGKYLENVKLMKGLGITIDKESIKRTIDKLTKPEK